MRPRGFRVYVIRRHGRHAAPILEAGCDKLGQPTLGQVRWRLDAHRRSEHQPRGGNRPEMIFGVRLFRQGHTRSRFWPEILNYDLLDVPVSFVQGPQSKQSFNSFKPGFANPDKEPGRERHRRFTGKCDRFEPVRGSLVGRPVVWTISLREAFARRLEHDPHGRADGAQSNEIVRAHYAGVEMRQQSRLPERTLGRLSQIVEGSLVAQLGQRILRNAVA